MNYTVHGISRSLSEWATTLGVAESDLQYEMRRGQSMQDIVTRLQVDTFSARGYGPPSRPPGKPPLSVFTSGAIVPGVRQSMYSITGSCASCMSLAREEYEQLHKAHLEHSEADRRAEIKAGKQPEK